MQILWILGSLMEFYVTGYKRFQNFVKFRHRFIKISPKNGEIDEQIANLAELNFAGKIISI